MKRLIVCCDGTWQMLENEYPTNIVKITQAIRPIAEDGISQIVFYDEGVGTESLFQKYLGGAFGRGIERNIQEAYRFLATNYEPGDEIYLFGFSRGAFTVRSLAGMIYCSGMLRREHLRKAPEAFKLYRARGLGPHSDEARRFRDEYGPQAPVKLLGCFDTVGALGMPNFIPWLPFEKFINRQYQFHDFHLNRKIEYALHAVAVDERRKVFDLTPLLRSKNSDTQVVRQAWFPGGHGSVGGGEAKEAPLADRALQWMIEQIRGLRLGLDVEESRIHTEMNANRAYGLHPNHLTAFDIAIKGIYRLTGAIYRKLPENFDDLDVSVLKRWRDRPDYRPKHLKKAHGDRLDAWAAN